MTEIRIAKIGEPISEKQERILQAVLRPKDLPRLTRKADLSLSTFRGLYYGSLTVTAENIKAVEVMINEAFRKVDELLTTYKKLKSDLERMLPRAV